MKRFLFLTLLIYSLSFSSIEAAQSKVYLGGDTVTIQGKYDGVVISGMYDFKIDEQWISPVQSSELQIGDKIISIEGKQVNDLDDLYEHLSLNPRVNSEYTVNVIRNQTRMTKKLKVYYLEEEKMFKTGFYVKDKIKGIGTISFYNPSNQTYGALGHEIMDNDLGKIAEISAGELFLASVHAIVKSKPKEPGEKSCLNTQIKIGSVVKNSNYGLYGYYYSIPSNKQLIETAAQTEVKTGPAIMYTVIEGQNVIPVNIHINSVALQMEKAVKGFQFTITDSSLITKTGGILQGMSGSPIVQNNKLIGAVTHMITASPANGYAIHIQWMLDESQSLD